ncbi:hypothetical protein NEOC65_002055 [Neochlamydia sp. AcF65]|nr:hypothetical protein [Neochlamydia sp. AcF65]MBS4170669.1 hypothetical protein [Neochlamydia sp. AcF95]
MKHIFSVFYEKGGRFYKRFKRDILEAILYVNHTGYQWRHLPHDYPH